MCANSSSSSVDLSSYRNLFQENEGLVFYFIFVHFLFGLLMIHSIWEKYRNFLIQENPEFGNISERVNQRSYFSRVLKGFFEGRSDWEAIYNGRKVPIGFHLHAATFSAEGKMQFIFQPCSYILFHIFFHFLRSFTIYLFYSKNFHPPSPEQVIIKSFPGFLKGEFDENELLTWLQDTRSFMPQSLAMLHFSLSFSVIAFHLFIYITLKLLRKLQLNRGNFLWDFNFLISLTGRYRFHSLFTLPILILFFFKGCSIGWVQGIKMKVNVADYLVNSEITKAFVAKHDLQTLTKASDFAAGLYLSSSSHYSIFLFCSLLGSVWVSAMFLYHLYTLSKLENVKDYPQDYCWLLKSEPGIFGIMWVRFRLWGYKIIGPILIILFVICLAINLFSMLFPNEFRDYFFYLQGCYWFGEFFISILLIGMSSMVIQLSAFRKRPEGPIMNWEEEEWGIEVDAIEEPPIDDYYYYDVEFG